MQVQDLFNPIVLTFYSHKY